MEANNILLISNCEPLYKKACADLNKHDASNGLQLCITMLFLLYLLLSVKNIICSVQYTFQFSWLELMTH